MSKTAYDVIKLHYITEKTTMLSSLADAESNRSLARCKSPKYVFIVDDNANKAEIARAVEEIYSDRGIQVVGVNTIRTKPKPKRMGRGKPGYKPSKKKAIVTLRPEDSLEDV